MSGVFGIVQKTGVQRSVAPTLERMANTLKLRSWHVTRMWVAPEAQSGLGQSNIGIISTDPQPVFSEDQSIAAVLFGEVYNTPALQQELKAKGVICRTESSAELILRLYEDCGLALPGRLQGVFALAIWDQKRSRLLLANDRYGLIPHYYAHFNQRLIFSPLVAGILQDAEFHRSLNLDAVADFMRFQRLLGKKTFFEGLHLLPYGSQLVYQADRDELSVTHYWDFDQIPTWPAGASFQEVVEEVKKTIEEEYDWQNSVSGLSNEEYITSGCELVKLFGVLEKKAGFGTHETQEIMKDYAKGIINEKAYKKSIKWQENILKAEITPKVRELAEKLQIGHLL